ncbi:MAG: hypothetical protein ACREMY_22565 [bacterium]
MRTTSVAGMEDEVEAADANPSTGTLAVEDARVFASSPSARGGAGGMLSDLVVVLVHAWSDRLSWTPAISGLESSLIEPSAPDAARAGLLVVSSDGALRASHLAMSRRANPAAMDLSASVGFLCGFA